MKYLRLDERREIHRFWLAHNTWLGKPSHHCPSCDRLPGGWRGWCHRCGSPEAPVRSDLCRQCQDVMNAEQEGGHRT